MDDDPVPSRSDDALPVPPALVQAVRRVLDSVDLGLIVVDPGGVVVFANEQLSRLLGPHVELRVGAAEPDLAERILQTDGPERRLSDPVAERSWRYSRDDTDLRWFAGTTFEVEADGAVYAVATVVDQTAHVEAEDARSGAIAVQRQLSQQLEEAVDELERSNAELDRFAGALAHDLKGPLANIASFAHLLPSMTGDTTGDAAVVISRIEANARRAMGMVTDLLAYARSVGEVYEHSPTPLGSIVSWAVEALEDDLRAVGGLVSWDDLPTVLVNEAALRQVFLNLIGNSLKYRAEDRRPAVRILSETGPGSTTRVRIIDNGIGIPRDMWNRVFELGVRAEHDLQGTGIGLASSRAVVDAHGGSIAVIEPADGIGTTIELVLPLAVVGTHAPAEERGTVLVVDDDRDVAAVLRLFGRRMGLELVGEAVNGQEAFEVYSGLEEPPSVIVLDLTLPDIDGFEVARRILGVNPHQHIILHTAHLDDAVQSIASEIGIDTCVAKGSTDAILEALGRVTGPAASDAPAEEDSSS